MKEQLSDSVNDQLESEQYTLKFYFGSIPPDEIEKAKKEALNDINNN